MRSPYRQAPPPRTSRAVPPEAWRGTTAGHAGPVVVRSLTWIPHTKGPYIVETTYEPAVFPLHAIMLETPLYVKALRTKSEVRAGNVYYIVGVHRDGSVKVMGCNSLYAMDMFVELLHPVVTGSRTATSEEQLELMDGTIPSTSESPAPSTTKSSASPANSNAPKAKPSAQQ